MDYVRQYIRFNLAKTENVKFLMNKGSHNKDNIISYSAGNFLLECALKREKVYVLLASVIIRVLVLEI